MRLRKDIEPVQLCAVCAAGLYTADYAGRLYCVYTMWSSTGSSVHLWGHKSISLHIQLNYDDLVRLLVETNCLFINLSVDRKPVKSSRITLLCVKSLLNDYSLVQTSGIVTLNAFLTAAGCSAAKHISSATSALCSVMFMFNVLICIYLHL